MNNQFATQHLLNELDTYDSLRSILSELGASEEAIEMLITAVEKSLLTPSRAVEITKASIGVNETSSVGGMVTGGPTAASVTSGNGEQYFSPARKKVKEDAPRLAGSPAKTNKQGARNLSAYKNFGFTKAQSAEEAGKKLKSIDVEELWEANRYSQFKRETSTRSKPQQMHEAAKIINRKLEDINKLLEFTKQMKTELAEGDQVVEYNTNTKKVFEKIHNRVVEVYSKLKGLK